MKLITSPSGAPSRERSRRARSTHAPSASTSRARTPRSVRVRAERSGSHPRASGRPGAGQGSRAALWGHEPEPGRTQRPRGRQLEAADAQDRRERSRRRPAETQVPAPGGHVGARETPDAERGEAAGERARRVAEADARPARIRDEGDRRYGRAEELAGAVLEDERDVLPRQPELRQQRRDAGAEAEAIPPGAGVGEADAPERERPDPGERPRVPRLVYGAEREEEGAGGRGGGARRARSWG